MQNFNSPAGAQMAQDTFLNQQGLNSVKKMGRENGPEAMRQMARQFESLFVQQMLKSMRAAGDVFSEGNYMSSSDTKFYRDMLDQQWSLELTQGQGIGLAEQFYQQMMHRYQSHLPSGSGQGNGETQTPKAAPVTAPVPAADSPDSETDKRPQAGFIDAIKPYANWAAKELGVSPDALMAQAALETGWGEKVIRDESGKSSFNLFNIKAGSDWQGDKVSTATTEYEGDKPESVQAEFKRYGSVFDSFADYVELMKKPRYQQAVAAGGDAAAYVERLQQAGYATDPAYADKLKSIMARGPLSGSAELAAYQSNAGDR